MKKTKSVLLCALVLPVLAGCGGSGEETSKNTIVIEPFAGSGFGYQFIIDCVEDWKKVTEFKDYDIEVLTNSMNMADGMLNEIAGGVSRTDIFYGANPEFNPGFYKDYFEELTTFVENACPDNDGVTIKDKIMDYEKWEKLASKFVYNDTKDTFERKGLYMIPYTSTVNGLVFDYDSFIDKGYIKPLKATSDVTDALTSQGITYETDSLNQLKFVSSTTQVNYRVGDYIVDAGQDGKYGTYDDGQPKTMSEFNDLVALIGSNYTPFVYAAADPYLDSLFYNYFAQSMGHEAYLGAICFDSNEKPVEMYDGTSEVITLENGYKAYNAKGLEEATNFIYKNFAQKKRNTKNPDGTYTTGTTTQNAQTIFTTGGYNDDKYVAFIAEGNWFESEARLMIDDAGKKDPSKKFGTVRYRMLVTPQIDGQKGIDGNGHGSFMAGIESGAITVRKQADPEKLSAIYDFLKFSLSDYQLAEATSKTGLVRPYKYKMTDEQYNRMTDFTRNCFDLVQDTENIKTLPYETDKLVSPVGYASKSVRGHGAMPCGGSYYSPAYAVVKDAKKPEEVVSYLRNNYTETSWNNILDEIRESLR